MGLLGFFLSINPEKKGGKGHFPFRVPHIYALNCGVGVGFLCGLRAEFLLRFLPLPLSGLENGVLDPAWQC